ncbi:MAG: hypothetical protein H0W48_00350 [Methylibium sp.]|nr:hypothetical protein [Methylibium sp.]
MIVSAALRLIPAWAWAFLLSLALATAGGVGWRQGAARVQGQWDAAELERERAIADKLREDARISRAASAEFERQRADQQRKQARVANDLRQALQRPVSCPAVLADVVVPADVVRLLHDAGADQREPAAASEPRR